jgi:hypothetical protein
MEMPDSLQEVDEGLKRMADNAKRFDTSMGHSEISIRKIVMSLVGADVAKTMWNMARGQSEVLKSVSNGFAALQATTRELSIRNKTLSSDLREFNALADERIRAGETTVGLVNRERGIMEEQLRISKAQVDAKTTLSRFTKVDLFSAALTLTAVTQLYHTHRMLNTSLIEANSSMHTRVGLTRDALTVQHALGSELNITRDAARELVNYGYDLETSFADNLKLVTQMHDGIGMSVAQGAELVAVYDRQLKSPVRSVADAIARIVNDTGLAADQAGRLATNIGRAIAALRPGINRDLAGVNELVGRYEGALQELGGQFGQFGDLLTRMTTPEGMMQAGMLGVDDPTFLASKDATKRVVDSFASYAKSVLGDSRGWDRALRLNVIAEQFGVTGQQANLMIMAVDRANKQRTTSLTLEERWFQQVRASGDPLLRLKNSLYALMQQAVIPLVPPIVFVTNEITSLIKRLTDLPGTVYIVGAAMLITTGLMIPRIWSAVGAFAALTATLVASARAAQARTISESSQLMLPGFGQAGPGGTSKLLSTTLPKIVKFLGVIAAFKIGWDVGKAIMEWRSKVDPKFNSELKQTYDEALRTNLKHFAASGDMDSIKNAVERARGVYTRRGERPEQIESRLARLTAELVDDMGTARFRKEVAESSIERDPASVKASADLVQAQTEMIAIAEVQKNAALKQNDLQREQNKKDEERKEEEERRFRLQQNQFMSNRFLNQAYGY